MGVRATRAARCGTVAGTGRFVIRSMDREQRGMKVWPTVYQARSSWGFRKEELVVRKLSVLVVSLIGVAASVLGVASPASAAGPNSFSLHLTCENGQSYDIFVNDGHSVAALVEGSSMVAVLKNGNGTVVPAFNEGGPLAGTLVSCDTGIPGFTALVLFTPASLH